MKFLWKTMKISTGYSPKLEKHQTGWKDKHLTSVNTSLF